MNQINSQVVFQDDWIVVADKAAGILSQPDKSGGTVLADELRRALKLRPQDFLAPAHRLDRNTSGLLVLARSAECARLLKEAMEAGEVERVYHALVKGDPGAGGTVALPLLKNEAENRSYVDEAGAEAITHFQRLKQFATCSLLEVRLETGRSHQIRAHFSHLGHPLLGDHKYAPSTWARMLGRPALHAVTLSFAHPKTGQTQRFQAPYPEDLDALIRRFAQHS